MSVNIMSQFSQEWMSQNNSPQGQILQCSEKLQETQEIKVAKFHVNKPQAKCPFNMKLCCRLKN